MTTNVITVVTDNASEIVSEVPATSVVYVATGPQGPPGDGDMQSLIYDPTGVRDNCFNLANLSGNLDAGTF